MKKGLLPRIIRFATGFALCLIVLFIMVPTMSQIRIAGNMRYLGTDYGDDTVTIHYCCNNCSADFYIDIDKEEYDGDVVSYIEDDCGEIELETDYCEYCYFDHLCPDCLREIEDCEMFCYNCHLCDECHTEWYCGKCLRCDGEKCQDCYEAGHWICKDCHPDYAYCDGCGACLYALKDSMQVCYNEATMNTHCTECDADWICSDCCECFFGREEYFCEECGMCLECAGNANTHCKHCYECYSSVSQCEGDEESCIDCCVAAGNHCELCEEHIEDVDEWCEGGKECGHCYACASAEGWICEGCGDCILCNDFEFCEECHLCVDCCAQNAADAGCECLEFCVQSGDFQNPEHMCEQCASAFSCSVDFCEECGLCADCCRDNSESLNCVCGLCVESDEFEEHLCPACGDPTCVGGELCEDCGLCEECCLLASEAEGCSCGICVENDEFNSPDHRCENCAQFSCNIDFCSNCGLCLDCCADDPEDIVPHGTITEPGTIYVQPSARRRNVTRNTLDALADNTVSFRVRAYDPSGDIHYQWYVRIDGGEAEKLEEDVRYIESRNETLVFVEGADTDRLTVAVPSDSCHREYNYFCVVSDGSGKTLSTSSEARLYGRHTYAYQWVDEEGHMAICVGEGCGQKENNVKKEHAIGPWQFEFYATVYYGAKLTRSCNACGGVAETLRTEPLEEDHTAHDYIYVPVLTTKPNGEVVCVSHEMRCRCGMREGAEEKHVFGEWIVTKQATETAKGEKYHECLLCQYREKVVIQRQTHEHLWNLHDWQAEFYNGGYSSTSHFQYCGDPDCNATAFVEPHQYSNWTWQRETGVDLMYKDAYVMRTCEVCGYRQVKRITKEYHALCFVNATRAAVSADKWSGTWRTYSATAKVPDGYFFRYWDVKEGQIRYAYHDVYYDDGTPVIQDGRVVRKQYSRNDETIEFTLVHFDKDGEHLPIDDIFCLEAVCERYDNYFTLYDAQGNKVWELTAENWVDDNDLFGTKTVIKDDEYGVLWYETQDEDSYGERTVVLHMNGYNGGPIELNDTGLPCNLKIIVEGDSTITSAYRRQGILGCLSGGEITISSDNGSTLSVNVRSGRGDDCYGIRAGKNRNYHTDKVTLCGNVNVDISVTNTLGGSVGAAYGIYSDTWVAIEDGANLTVDVGSYAWDVAYDGQKITSAIALHAGKQVGFNTDGYVFLRAVNVDTANGRRGIGVDAKNTVIEKVGQLEIDYTDNARSACNHAPTYDPQSYIFYDYDNGTTQFIRDGKSISTHSVKHLMMVPGIPVTFEVSGDAVLNVASYYKNKDGDYLVEPGLDLTFWVAPSAGRYKAGADIGGVSLKPSSSDDGVRTRYVIDKITEPITVHVGDGMLFSPFKSQPALSQTAVYFGSEAQLSFTMNDVLSSMASHEKFGGNAIPDPKFALKALEDGNYKSGQLIESSQTINTIFLQRWNEAAGRFENTGVTFTPAELGRVSFTDAKCAPALKTVRYRLMVRYDGRDYPSDEFTVTWTDDPNDSTDPMTAAVELYISDGKNANGGRGFDGGAWVRLDSENDLLVFDVTTSDWVGFAISGVDYLRQIQRHTRDLVKFAEFDYHTGELKLYGDFPTADFDGDGEEEWYDLGAEIEAIRVPADAPGSLVINVLADTWVEGDWDEFGWDAYRDGDTLVRWNHKFAQTDVILNEYGGVRVTSEYGAVLDLDRSGSMAHKSEGRSYAAVRAAGDVTVDGDATLRIGIGLNETSIWWNNYGADRYGIVSDGTFLVCDTAEVRVRLPIPDGRHMIGATVAVDAERVDLKDDSVTILDCSSDEVYDGATCFALQTGSLNVSGSARLTVKGQGDVITPIYVDGDAIFATEDEIKISALGGAEATRGVSLSGTLYLRAPTTLTLEYFDGGDGAGLVDEGGLTQDDFVVYHTPGEGDAPAKSVWHPGVPYTVAVGTDYGAEDFVREGCPDHVLTVRRGGKVLLGQTGTDARVDVCFGDRVTFTAADAYDGYEFAGWVMEDNTAPEDLEINGATVSFTMPDRDVHMRASYTCIAFLGEPPCFVITNEESTEGVIYWQVNTNYMQLGDVELEYLVVNEDGSTEWRSFRYYENDEELGWSLYEDMERLDDPDGDGYIYRGVSRIGLEGSSTLPRTVDTETYRTYRIHAWSGADFYSDPFAIDFSDGIHVLIGDDRDNAELVIPADYVGTEFLITLSNYVWSDSAKASYSLSFADGSGPIPASLCDVRIFENGMMRAIRGGACEPVAAYDGDLWVDVTFENCPRTFRIPFNFDGVWDAEVYPLIVSGVKVTSQNKDDILGGGTAYYDPDTKTLTLDGAVIDEIYPVRSDAELSSAAYAIVGARDLTINLIGENVISVTRTSFCHTQALSGVFHGSIVGIGNAINDSWRPYLTEDDDFRLTFTGSGSLDVRVEGVSGMAINSLGDVTVEGGDITLRTKYSGISSETGSFTMNGGSLDIDAKELCCIELQDNKARFTVNGGSLKLNGGTEYYAVSMSAVNYQNAEYFQIYDGDVTIETKSDHWDLCSREMYYSDWLFSPVYKDGSSAFDHFEAPETIKDLDYVRFIRTFPIWVNGEQFTSEHKTIACGEGTAVYDPDENTVYLRSAKITTGVADWSAMTTAAGIYTEIPVTLNFSGFTTIDLSGRNYVNMYGAPYELQDDETEAARYVYGIFAWNPHGIEDHAVSMTGDGSILIRNTRYGIETNPPIPIVYDGPNLTVTGCEGGVSADMKIDSGSVKIESSAYSIYGILDVSSFEDINAFGGATKESAEEIDLDEAGSGGERGWGFEFPYLRICGDDQLHEHQFTTVLFAPTCTEDGYTLFTCECGNSYTDNYVDALGHDYRAAVTAPTCTAKGYTTYTCSRCGGSYSGDYVAATGHSYKASVTAPTCTEKGYTAYTCSRCGDSYIENFKNALGHDFGKDGKAEKCSRCGEKNTGYKPAPSFEDVPKDAYYADAVNWAVANGITRGVSATKFGPDNGCTRGQVVTFLWRAVGEPAPKSSANPFSDVGPADYYYSAVLWAVENGVTAGTSKTTFSPNSTCTRGQIVTFLYRFEGSPAPKSSNNPFSDVSEADYFYSAVLWAVGNDITKGTSATAFSPNSMCTRAQIVTFLYRAMN